MGSCQSRSNETSTALPSRYSPSSRQVHSEDAIVSQRERAEALEQIRKRGWEELSRMPDKLRDDEAIVGMAVEMAMWGSALQLASPRLRADRTFVLRAIRVDCKNAQYASPQLKNDQAFVLDAIHIDWRVLLSLPEAWRGNKIAVLAAVQQSGRALRHASEDLRNDRNIVAAAVQQTWQAFPYASPSLKADFAIARRAFFQNGNVFDEVDNMLKDDVELLAMSIRFSQNLEFRWREALQMHKSSLSAAVARLLEQERINRVQVRTLGQRRQDESDWKGTGVAQFTHNVWKHSLYYKVWLLYQKVGRLGPVFQSILEYSNIRHDAQQANTLIRLAPLLATLHLRGIVDWRNLPDAFPDPASL